MSKRHEVTGISAYPSGLLVQFTCGERAAKRIEDVVVPWEWLDLQSITDHLDKEARRRLKVWQVEQGLTDRPLDFFETHDID